MAGDWIKMRADLAEDPAVIGMAARLGLDEYAVVGRLHAFWSWLDRQSRNGHADGVTHSWLDRHMHCEGFAAAMVAVGWLTIGADGLTAPNFDRHNGETAKARALTTNRKRKQRSVDVTQEVTLASRSDRDIIVTREEKRREETESKTSRPRRKAPSDTPPRFADDSTEMKAAKYLFEKMLANNPTAKEPNWREWARDVDRILRIDMRDKDELRRVIDWCQSDPFWLQNILSPAKLRKQYERLAMGMRAPQKPVPQRKGPAPHPLAPHLPPFTN